MMDIPGKSAFSSHNKRNYVLRTNSYRKERKKSNHFLLGSKIQPHGYSRKANGELSREREEERERQTDRERETIEI